MTCYPLIYSIPQPFTRNQSYINAIAIIDARPARQLDDLSALGEIVLSVEYIDKHTMAKLPTI